MNRRRNSRTSVPTAAAMAMLFFLSFPATGLALSGADVAIYNDTAYPNGGAWPEGLAGIKAMLDEYGYTHEDLTPAEINAPGNLDTSRYKVLIFGGGWAAGYNELISATGLENIRRFVRTGGGYFGICAGAYFACDRICWTPDYVTPSHVYDYPLNLFYGFGRGAVVGIMEFNAPTGYSSIEYGAKMTTVDMNENVLPGIAGDLKILYFGGPWFDTDTYGDKTRSVVATYRVPGDPADNMPAMILFSHGRGRVFLTGPHPEVSFENGVIYSDANTWALMNKVISHLISSGAASKYRAINDYEGDGKSDPAVYQGSTGYWAIHKSLAGMSYTLFGAEQYKAVEGDFNGDGISDMTLYDCDSGYWYVLSSGQFQLTSQQFGGIGYDPVRGDFDGDGISDLGVYNADSGYWFILLSSSGELSYQQFGGPGYVPVRADFDGDGKSDLAVFHASTGYWYWLPSSTLALNYMQLGATGYTPVPGDYDGDGKSDLAVFHEISGLWYVYKSSDASLEYRTLGGDGYTPAPGDFDGDGKTDYAIYQESTGLWRIMLSSHNTLDYHKCGGWGYSPVQ